MTHKPYPRYKKSGIEWVGKVPEHWESKPLKRIGQIKYGIGEPPQYQLEGTPLIRATNVHEGKLIEDGMVFVNHEDITKNRIFWLQVGDIIIVRSGAYTGDSARIPNGYRKSIAGFDMILRCYKDDSKFVQYALLSKYLKQDQIDLEKLRAAQPHLNAEELGSCLFIAPPLSEQLSITSFLDRETSRIDTLISEKERLISLLQEYRQALISHAVTKGLDPKVKMKDSGVEWLGNVPEHWIVASLRHVLLNIFNGLTSTQIDESENTVPVTRIETISSGIIDEGSLGFIKIEEAKEEKRLLVGDILFSNINSLNMIGNCAIYLSGREIYAGMNLLVLRPNLSTVDKKWFYWLIRSNLFRQKVESLAKPAINQASISQSSLVSIKVPIPPLSEQLAISSFLDRETSHLDTLISESRTFIDLLKEYRSSLITAAVTGKIDVRGFSPVGSERESAHE